MTEPPTPSGDNGCPELPGREPGESWTRAVRPANPQRNPVILRRVLHGLENLPDTAPSALAPGRTAPL